MVIAGLTRVRKRFHYEHSKACIRCSTIKDVSEFYAMPSKGGRLHAYCKDCNRTVRREWERDRVRDARRGAYEHAVRTIASGKPIAITLLPLDVRYRVVGELLATRCPPKAVARMLRCNVETVRMYARRSG